jgi:large subunit ribosomal protein L25
VIALGSDTLNAVLQDIQFHPVTDRILHIDFYQLFDDKEIAMNIPVNLIGKSPGVANGGSLMRNKRKLRVKALPTNLPDFIEADISLLKIGSKLYITELANESFKFLHPDNTVVCQVKRSRVSIDEEEEETEEEGTVEGAAPTAEGSAAPADA